MATVEDFKVKVSVDGTNKLDQLGSSASLVAGKMTALGAAILGVGFGAFLSGALRSADAMSDLSDATDITLGSIIAFGQALEASGGKSKNTERSILALYNAIELAADGGGKQQKAFDKLNISLDDLRTMSDADILNKTIAGLKELGNGSDAAQVKAALLGRSFRAVDSLTFADNLAAAKAQADNAAQGQKNLADFNQKLEKTFVDLQLAAGEVLGPFLNLFDGVAVSSTAAKVAVGGFAAATALVFGSAVISSIGTFITLYKEVVKIIRSATIAQTALVALSGPKGWAVIAGAALVTAGAYVALDKAMSDAAETAKKAPGAPTGTQGVDAKNVGGKVTREATAYISPERQAAADSEKRILASQAEFRKSTEMSTTNEIKNIRLSAAAEIEKMEIEVNNNKLLSSTQKEREIAARRIEINKKADFDVMRNRMETEKAMADQLNTITMTTKERERGFELERQMIGMSGASAEKARLLADLENQRLRAIEEAARIKGMDPGLLAQQVEAINQQYESQKLLAEQQVEFQRDFETGWSKSFQAYVDNATNAATQAQAMFQAMTNGMNSALDKFVDTGKFSFSDLTNSIIKDIIKIQLRAAAARLFSAGSNFLGFSLPGRATGGPVSSGMPYMVGENGPEMFIPAQAGNIMANDKLNKLGGGASPMNITYNIQAVDAMSFKQMVARDPSFLYAVTEQGRKTIPSTRR